MAMIDEGRVQRVYALRPRKVDPPPGESVEQSFQRFDGQIVSSRWNTYDQNPLRGKPPGPPPFQPRPIESSNGLCYHNALTQALFHVPKVANWLKFHHEDCLIGTWCVACGLKRLLDSYWTLDTELSYKKRTREAVALVRTCQMSGDNRTGGWSKRSSQSDLSDDWRENQDHDREFSRQNDQEDAQEYWIFMYNAFIRQLQQDAELVKAMFGIGVQYSWRCPHCKTTHPSELEFGASLALASPTNSTATHHTLSELLKYHFGPAQNSIEGINCDHASCLKKVSSTHRQPILKVAPDVLIIQLTLFRQDSPSHYSKIETPVHFSQKLNMSPYYDGPRNSLRYHLLAVIQHSGDGLEEGHYITIARDPRGRWNELNDTLPPSRVPFERTFKPEEGFSPYLLFYKRILCERAEYPTPVPET